MTNITPTFDNNTERYRGAVTYEEAVLNNINTYIKVADWQRNYRWLEEHCDVLLNDILKMLGYFNQNIDMPHYLGQMVFTTIEKNSKDYGGKNLLEVADGQQRITSILLLCLAIRDIAVELLAKQPENKTELEEVIERANNYIFIKINGEKVLRLKLNEINDYVLKAIVFNENYMQELSEDLLNKENHPEKCRIYPNYNHFVIKVKSFLKNGISLKSLLDGIARLDVTRLFCRTSNDAFDVYISENNKGVGLEGFENAKARLLYLYKDLIDENNPNLNKGVKIWTTMENKVGLNNVKKYITDILVLFNKKENTRLQTIIPSKLDRIVVKMIHQLDNQLPNDVTLTEKEKGDKFFSLIEKYIDIYAKYIYNIENINYVKATDLEQAIYRFECIGDLEKCNSILMYLLDLYEKNEIKEKVLIETLDALTCLQVRRKIAGSSDFRNVGYNNAVSLLRFVVQEHEAGRINKLDYAIWERIQIAVKSAAFPLDKTIKSRYAENQLANDVVGVIKNNIVTIKYIMYHINKKYDTDNTMPDFSKDLILEHAIIPNNHKSWVEQVHVNENEIPTYVNRFGNYVLVNRRTDEENFAHRQDTYKKSEFPIAKQIGNTVNWNKNDIKYLTQFYIREFCKLFAIPKKYRLKRA